MMMMGENAPGFATLLLFIQAYMGRYPADANSGLIIEIQEELPAGSVIIDNIHRSLHLNSDHTTHTSIGNPSSAGISQLTLHSRRSDGSLQLIVKPGHRGPDREKLCDMQSVMQFPTPAFCDIPLVIVHGNPQHPSYAKITLRILDINDNAPVFPNGDRYEVLIPEDQEKIDKDNQRYFTPSVRSHVTPMIYPLPIAYDPDIGENSVKYYRLTTRSGQEIDNPTIVLVNKNDGEFQGLHQITSPALKVIGSLDREKISEYWFNLLAVDGGVPEKTGTLLVHVAITDVNDNFPVFRKPVFHFPTILPGHLKGSSKEELLRIPESIMIGTDLITLVADDMDDGANANLSYRIVEDMTQESGSSAVQYFELVHSSVGVKVRVKSKLDADKVVGTLWSDADVTGNLLRITVEAVDSGTPSLSSSITIPVLVENVNDNRPEISINFVNPLPQETLGLVGSLKENIPGPVTIAHVTVTDADRATFMQVDGRRVSEGISCEINDTRFSLDQISGLSDQFTVDMINTAVVKQVSSYFYRMTALKSFDREEGEWIYIRITCIDQVPTGQFNYIESQQYRSNGQLTGSIDFSLQIIDENDNPPKFSQDRYTFTVKETASDPDQFSRTAFQGYEKVTVGQVVAVDADTGLNGQVKYKLNINPQDTFEIDETQGIIRRVGILDREKLSKVELTVNAYDQGDPTLSCTCVVEILVQDVNDHPPYWISPVFGDTRWVKSEDGVFYFSVPENAEVGHVFGTLMAVDIDGLVEADLMEMETKLPNAGLVYQLEQNEDSAVFSINRKTGELRLSRYLDRESRAHYELRALVIDNTDVAPRQSQYLNQHTLDTRRFTATSTVFITVLDVNDNTPQFDSPLPGQEFRIDPTTATPGTTLFTASAHDADSGENATVRYKLEGEGHGLVEIDTTTGVCYIREFSHRNALLRSSIDSHVVIRDSDLNAASANAHAHSDVSSLHLNLVIVAYDTGRPRSLNSSRSVRLVWSAPNSKDSESALQNQGLLRGIYGTYGGKFTRIEHLLIPLLIGAFLLLIVVCCILFGFSRRRRFNKTRMRAEIQGGDENGIFHCCTHSDHHSEENSHANGKVSSSEGTLQSQADKTHSKENNYFATNEIKPRRTSSFGLIAGNSCLYLPDCVPSLEAGLKDQGHQNVSHFLITQTNPHIDWRAKSRNTVSRLSKALSEESLTMGKPVDVGYTALCAFPSRPHEDNLFSHTIYRTGQDIMEHQNERSKLHRPIAYRPQTLSTMKAAATTHQTFQPADYTMSPDETLESPQYEQFEMESSERIVSADTNPMMGAGWKPRWSEAYTENTFV